MHRGAVILVFLVLLLGACSSDETDVATTATQSPPVESSTVVTEVITTGGSEVVVARQVEYSTTSVKRLDIYSPVGPGPWPVVLLVHGVSQSKGSLAPLAEAISSEGAVVFNVDSIMSPPFDVAIEEVACSVRFAAATAVDYGGDPGKITLVGNSAGAATGMIVAMVGDELAQDCTAEGPAELDAVVGYEGPYDWAATVYGPIVDLPALESTAPELWAAVDPYSHLGRNTDLVVRLVHGDDTNPGWFEVPRAVSVDFHQALEDAGYDAEITLVDGASHTAITTSGNEAFDTTVTQALELAQD